MRFALLISGILAGLLDRRGTACGAPSANGLVAPGARLNLSRRSEQAADPGDRPAPGVRPFIEAAS